MKDKTLDEYFKKIQENDIKNLRDVIVNRVECGVVKNVIMNELISLEITIRHTKDYLKSVPQPISKLSLVAVVIVSFFLGVVTFFVIS